MKTCQRGHEYRGDENYRATIGCPVCFEAVRRKYAQTEKSREARRRYFNSEKGREAKRRANARTNAQRVRASGMYLGFVGFSVNETEAMLDGSSD